MENECVTPLSMVSQWRERYGDMPFGESADLAGDVREMCRCLRRYPLLEGTSLLDRQLLSWFMPRNQEDLDCFIRRYRVWCELPDMIAEKLTERRAEQ